MDKIKKTIIRLVKTMSKEGVSGLPAQISFYFIWSLIPLMMAIGVISGFFDIANDFLIDTIKSSTIGDLSEIVVPYLENKDSESISVLVIITPIYLASKSFNSLINVSEVLYDFKIKSYIEKKLYAILLTLGFIFLLMFIIIIPIFGSKILSFVFEYFNLRNFYLRLILALKWPFSLLVIYLGVLSIYIGSLGFRVSVKKLVFGALFTTVGWAISSFLYELYLNNFADYSIYGSFANIIIIFFWFYILSYIFVLGAALNVALDKNIDIP